MIIISDDRMEYKGCFKDKTADRAMGDGQMESEKMTNIQCADFCTQKHPDAKYAGTQVQVLWAIMAEQVVK